MAGVKLERSERCLENTHLGTDRRTISCRPSAICPCPKVTFSACISACEKCHKWESAVELLSQMTRKRVDKNLITYSACISACAGSGQWEQSLSLLQSMRSSAMAPDRVACNACITSCARGAQSQMAVGLLQSGCCGV